MYKKVYIFKIHDSYSLIQTSLKENLNSLNQIFFCNHQSFTKIFLTPSNIYVFFIRILTRAEIMDKLINQLGRASLCTHPGRDVSSNHKRPTAICQYCQHAVVLSAVVIFVSIVRTPSTFHYMGRGSLRVLESAARSFGPGEHQSPIQRPPVLC